MQTSLKIALLTSVLVGGGILNACVPPHVDTRLAEDQQTCQQMGHPAWTAAFSQCLAELNERRCAMAASKAGTRHVASEECTRLPSQR
jgi:hypothetical protein